MKTANCGYLQTLARGTARFRVSSGGCSVVLVMHDCLHALDVLRLRIVQMNLTIDRHINVLVWFQRHLRMQVRLVLS